MGMISRCTLLLESLTDQYVDNATLQVTQPGLRHFKKLAKQLDPCTKVHQPSSYCDRWRQMRHRRVPTCINTIAKMLAAKSIAYPRAACLCSSRPATFSSAAKCRQKLPSVIFGSFNALQQSSASSPAMRKAVTSCRLQV